MLLLHAAKENFFQFMSYYYPANIFFQVSSGFLPGFLPFFCRSRHVIGMCERVLFCRVVAALPGFLPIFFRAEAYMTMSEGFRKKTR